MESTLHYLGWNSKDADDNGKALRVIQWAGEPGTRQFKAWNIKAQELKIKTVWEKFEKIVAPTKNFMRAKFNLIRMQQKENEPSDVWYQQIQAQIHPCEYNEDLEAIQLTFLY